MADNDNPQPPDPNAVAPQSSTDQLMQALGPPQTAQPTLAPSAVDQSTADLERRADARYSAPPPDHTSSLRDNLPLAGKLIADMITPRGSRLEAFEQFLGGFVNALGKGLSVPAGPGAFGRGFGAAIQAPYQQAAQQAQLQQYGAQTGEIEARAGQIEQQTRLMGQSVPVTLPNGQTVYVPAQQAAGILGNIYKGAGKPQARYINVPGRGLIDTQGPNGPTIVTGTQPTSVTVTDDMAAQYGLPKQLVGEDIDLRSLAELEKAGPKTTSSTQFARNPITGVMELSGTTTKTTGPAGAPRGTPPSGFPKPVAPTPTATQGNQGGQAGTPSPGAVNTAFLNSLPPESRNTIQAIGEGRMELTASMLRSKGGQQIVEAVNQAYPGFDQSRSSAYVSMRKDFTSGKTSQGINAFNTALAHLDRMYDHVNAFSTIPGVSAVARWTGNESAAALNTDRIAVSSELAKAYGAGQLTEGEMKQWKARLDAPTPWEMKNNLVEMAQLLTGKLNAYQNQWANGMPTGVTAPIQIMSTTARTAFNHIVGGTKQGATGNLVDDLVKQYGRR